MALTPCRECGQQVSTEAVSCPRCGVPNPTVPPTPQVVAPPSRKTTGRKRAADVFLLFLGLGIAILMVVSRNSREEGNPVALTTSASTDLDEAARRQVREQERKDAEAVQKAKKDAECRKDLACWAEKGTATAGIYCRDKVEKLANYTMKWTDAWYEQKFSHYRWSLNDRDNKGVVTYLGDKAQFQNGFGAFQNVIYTCDMVPDDGDHRILDVSVKPGRLN